MTRNCKAKGNIKMVEATMHSKKPNVWHIASASEAMADGQKDDEAQSYDNTSHNQLNLHILNPQFSPHLCPLCFKILCLKSNTKTQIIYELLYESWTEEDKKVNGLKGLF